METYRQERQPEARMSARAMTNHSPPLAHPRDLAVEETVARVAALLDGETCPGIAQAQCITQLMQELAGRSALWDSADFPIQEDRLWQAYLLLENAVGSHALYAVAMRPGHAQPPHDHTTWAVIAGVRGKERNSLYRRPRTTAEDPLDHLADITVTAGNALALGPGDLHAIEVLGPDPALHLHLYGKGFTHLQERRIFDLHTGAKRPFPPMQNTN